MDKINKNVFLFGGIAVALVVLFFIVKMNKNTDEIDLLDKSGVEDTTPAPGAPVVAPAKVLSYAEALVLYKDKRIQLDSICQASPANPTYKNNTKIMIDNRSDQTRTVKVGSTMTIKPWNFRIVNLSSSTLPTTWLVDCDKSQNVASILIQK